MMSRTSHYLGNHRSLVVTERGDRMYVDTRDIMITPGILCWGSWEPETTHTFERLLRPGMSWADVGANIGYFTIIGHRLVREGGGKTFAFEANPATFEILADNVRLNWFFDHVECEQQAAYFEKTKLKFGAPRKYAVNASISEANSGDWKRVNDEVDTFEVQAISLDEYFADTHLDFIKIDVEGAESYVLRGARKLVTRNQDIKILIEWSPGQMLRCKTNPQELVDLIEEFGFHVWLAESERRKITTQELLGVKSTTMLLLSRDANFVF